MDNVGVHEPPLYPDVRTDTARTALAAIGRQARARFAARAQEIEAVVTAAVRGEPVEESRVRSAHRAAHMIAGSAGSVGMPETSLLARELEEYLEGADLTDAARTEEAATTLGRLKQHIAQEALDHAGHADHGGERRHEILLAHSDPELAYRIEATAALRGWQVRTAVDEASAREHLATGVPAVIVLELDLPPHGYSTLAASAEGMGCPVVLIAGEAVTPDQVDVARGAGLTVLPSRLDPGRIVESAASAAGAPSADKARLLVLEDKPDRLAAVRANLAPGPFDVVAVHEPAGLLDALREGPPDVVLLDADMAGVDVVALCSTLRDDPRRSDLPILALTTVLSDENVGALLAAGVDDLVPVPIVGPLLASRISRTHDLVQLRRRITNEDPLTGLANRARFESEFALLADHAMHTGEPLSVAIIDLDHFCDLNLEHGHALGDTVLRRLSALLVSALEEHTVVGRWGGEEIILAMPGTRRNVGVARVAAVLESFRNESFESPVSGLVHATFSGAVAELPTDGRDLRTLIRVLAIAIAEAKREGRDRVIPTVRWEPISEGDTTDVFIVEDDDTLVSLLRQALETRGLRSEHEVDGAVALDRLLGPNPLRARVILLDVDLPGCNGREILKRLQEEGVLTYSRVVMLTASSSPENVRETAQFGAFDHIAKPFSLPILTQRLRRALDASS